MNKIISIMIMALWINIGCSQSIFAALRDPTRPPANIQGQIVMSPSAFVLNAIIRGHNRKVAVINGLNKQVGDEILGEHITVIYDNTVQLEGPSGKITLFLFGKPIKRYFQTVCKRTWNVCRDLRE